MLKLQDWKKTLLGSLDREKSHQQVYTSQQEQRFIKASYSSGAIKTMVQSKSARNQGRNGIRQNLECQIYQYDTLQGDIRWAVSGNSALPPHYFCFVNINLFWNHWLRRENQRWTVEMNGSCQMLLERPGWCSLASMYFLRVQIHVMQMLWIFKWKVTTNWQAVSH